MERQQLRWGSFATFLPSGSTGAKSHTVLCLLGSLESTGWVYLQLPCVKTGCIPAGVPKLSPGCALSASWEFPPSLALQTFSRFRLCFIAQIWGLEKLFPALQVMQSPCWCSLMPSVSVSNIPYHFQGAHPCKAMAEVCERANAETPCPTICCTTVDWSENCWWLSGGSRGMGSLFLAVSKCTKVAYCWVEERTDNPCLPYLGNKCEILASFLKSEL